jgi:hypothetical protein
VKGNFQARFWSSGGRGDSPTDCRKLSEVGKPVQPASCVVSGAVRARPTDATITCEGHNCSVSQAGAPSGGGRLARGNGWKASMNIARCCGDAAGVTVV